ncbi:MAG: hypothetical protein LUH14_01995 [Clostridiaceae bacterium]|nr:hypothetical protein [Clostridiaceae bacterium]
MKKKNKKKKFFEKYSLRRMINVIAVTVGRKQNQFLAGLLLIVMICLAFAAQKQTREKKVQETISNQITSEPESTPSEAASAPSVSSPTANPEEEIYTFLQGPKSWGNRLQWSGEWGETFYDGGSFGGFGCGLCCLANVYSSLTPYACTPVQAYQYAKKVTDYGGGGAIDWGYLRQTLSALGFQCEVKQKPSTYRQFREDIAAGSAAIVLVSSNDSKCYWTDTPGHYVTVFLYDQKKDKIFLADSGDPNHNRHWVSLKKIYRSLKTSSAWQYLLVWSYDKQADLWKHKNANGNWVR